MSTLATVGYFAVAFYAWIRLSVAMMRSNELMRGDKPWEFTTVGLGFFMALFWPLAVVFILMRRYILRLVG